MKRSFFKKITMFLFSHHRRALTSPFFAWNISLGIVGIFFIALLYWNQQFFNHLKKIDLSGSAAQKIVDTSVLDRKALEGLIDIYTARETKFNELKDTASNLVDPAL